jgi:undecaprenyl diphosphate synthase
MIDSGDKGMATATSQGRMPRHLAIIMDGNGRWATARGLPRALGHRAGTENLRRVLPAVIEAGIPVLTIYAFSTENWDRPQSEIRILLGLIERVIDNELDELNKNGVKIRHIGRTEGLAPRLVDKIAYAQQMTEGNDRLILNIAFNYGGRAELVDAVRQIVADGLAPEDVDEDTIGSYLSTSGLPDPDFIIRTGGDMRLSNFLVWQAVYAEFYCTPKYWPDFDETELHKALRSYQQRERRFGGLPTEPA